MKKAVAKRIYRRGRAFEQVLGVELRQSVPFDAGLLSTSAIGLKPAISLLAPAISLARTKG